MSNVVSKSVHWFKYTAIPWYTSLGITKGTITLEVQGRKNAKWIRVSLTTVRYNGSCYLVSLYDKSQWVKNVRAAGGQAKILSGGKTSVRLVEIPQGERAPNLLDMFNNGPSVIRVRSAKLNPSALAQSQPLVTWKL